MTLLELGRQRRSQARSEESSPNPGPFPVPVRQVDAVGLNSAISRSPACLACAMALNPERGACAGGPWEHRAQARSLGLALERVSLRRAMMILHSFAQFGGCLGERYSSPQPRMHCSVRGLCAMFLLGGGADSETAEWTRGKIRCLTHQKQRAKTEPSHVAAALYHLKAQMLPSGRFCEYGQYFSALSGPMRKSPGH